MDWPCHFSRLPNNVGEFSIPKNGGSLKWFSIGRPSLAFASASHVHRCSLLQPFPTTQNNCLERVPTAQPARRHVEESEEADAKGDSASDARVKQRDDSIHGETARCGHNVTVLMVNEMTCFRVVKDC